MAIQASRLNDDKYLHWLRTSLSLLYLKEGITPLCDEESTQFHKDIRGKVQLKSLFAATSTCSNCTYRDVKKRNLHGIVTWQIQCGRNICNEWLDEILRSHKDYPCPDIAWANSDPQLWPTDVWEVSKLFQPYGCASKKSAADSDCQGLLRLLKTCTHFHQFLSDRTVLEKINDVRNACMHSSSLQIEDAEMKRGLNLMISLLEQPHLKHRTSCVEAKMKILELRDNLLDISLNKELELQALNHKIAAVRSDVDHLEAELQQLQTSLSDVTTRQDSVTTRQDTTAEEYRKMCERVRELGQNITEIKTNQEQITQTIDPSVGSKMANLTSRLQELETNSNKEIERLEGSFQSTIAKMVEIETRVGNLETQRVAQHTDQPVDIKGLQCQLIRLYEAQRQHIPVYLLRSERKIRLEDIYVEQRLKVVDPDGRLKTDSTISHNRHQTRSEDLFRIDLLWTDSHGRTKADKNEKFINSLRDVFYSEGNKCQYVYVSGNAGYGKSVFCSHLVRLWCKAHSERSTKLTKDEKIMAEFPLLFCVDLRDATYTKADQVTDEISSLIIKQLQLSQLGLTDNDLSKLLQAEGQVLVVMDALDECKEERLPRGGLFNKCTTLVTSRPWKFEALRCDPLCRIDKELEIVGLKKGSPEDLSENLVKLLNKKWNKSKHSRDFIKKVRGEGLEEFLSVPVMLTSMMCLWHDDVPFGQSRCEIYKTSIHHQILAAVKAKDIPDYSCPSEAPFPICQREKCPCKRYVELLWKVSELACKALLGNVRERSLVMDHDQTEFLGLTDKEIAICMKLGILTQYKLLGNITDYEPQKSVSFTHKTYQEWFAAVYMSSKLSVSELDKLLSGAIVDLDSALELDQMFLFVCGMNDKVAAKLSEFIMSKVSSDTRVQEHRRDSDHAQLIKTIQTVIVAGAVEAKKNNKESTALQLHDVYIGWYSREQILACDTSHTRSVKIELVNIQERDDEESKITPWPASSCLEKLSLQYTTNALDDTFCANFSAASLVNLDLNIVALTHDQLESLCASLASAGSLRTVYIAELTCITHKDNRHDCSIMLDLSRHQGLEKLTLWDLDMAEVPGVSFCQNMAKLETVDLCIVTLTHDQLESLCQSLALAGSLRIVDISYPLCITHKDNRHDCSIMLDLSRHQGLEKLTLWDLVRGVSLCQNMAKLETVELCIVTLTHDQLESLCQSLALAGSLRIVDIDDLTCITHKDNRHDCSIMLDLSRHQGLEKLTLRNLGVGVSLCQNMAKLDTVELCNVTLTHDQLESLCQSLALAGSLRIVDINDLTCITHKDNRHDCSIMLDLSRHQGLKTLKLRNLGVGEVRGVSLCQNMAKLDTVELCNVTLTHDQLESLCQSLALAGSLWIVDINDLTCITHKDNRHDCSIMLDLSRHQGLEKLTLRNLGVGEVRGVSLCQNMAKLETVELCNVTLTHDQLESLCQSLALAGSLRIVDINDLTCITHKDNRHDCSIMLDLSRHQGLEKLTLRNLGVGEVRGVSLCQNMAKLKTVELCNVTLTHDQLESLCQSLALAGSLRIVDINDLTCITHKDNRHDCSIMLDLSRHQGLEKLTLRNLGVGEVRGVSLCQNMAKLETVELCNVTLTHDQLESLCQSLALAGSLRIVDINDLTCITHKDNRHDCSIMLDLSRHQGLEKLTLRNLGVGEVRGVSLCQNMDKLQWVFLKGFCISAGSLRQTLETLPEQHVEVRLGSYSGPSLRVRGAEEARKLLEEIRRATHTDVTMDDVEYMGDECVVEWFQFYNN